MWNNQNSNLFLQLLILVMKLFFIHKKNQMFGETVACFSIWNAMHFVN